MKSEDAKSKNFLRESSHANWRKFFVSVNEKPSEDVIEAAPSGNLARIFVGLLLAHVLLIGAWVGYNLVSEHTRWDNALTAAPLVKWWNSLMTPVAKIEDTTQELKPETTFGMQEYEVGSGDSIPSIAQKFGVYAAELIRVNHLDNGGEIYPGRKLSIPAKVQAMNDLVVARQTAPAFIVTQPLKLPLEDASEQVNFPVESLPKTTLAEVPDAAGKRFGTPEITAIKETLVEHPRLEDVLTTELPVTPLRPTVKSATKVAEASAKNLIALTPKIVPWQSEVTPALVVTPSAKIVKEEDELLKNVLKPTLAEMPVTLPKRVEEPLIAAESPRLKSASKTAALAQSLTPPAKPLITEAMQTQTPTLSSGGIVQGYASRSAVSPPEETRVKNSSARAQKMPASQLGIASASNVRPPPTRPNQEDSPQTSVPKAYLVESVPKAILVQVPDEAEKIQSNPPMSEKKTVKPAIAATKEKTLEKKLAAKPVTKPSVDNRVASARSYTITSRDTLITVARKFQVRVADLMRVNGMNSPSKLHEGEKLKIPPKSTPNYNNVAGDPTWHGGSEAQHPWFNQENGYGPRYGPPPRYGPRYGSRYYTIY